MINVTKTYLPNKEKYKKKLEEFTAIVRGEKSSKGRLSPFAKVTDVKSIPANFPDFTDFNIKY